MVSSYSILYLSALYLFWMNTNRSFKNFLNVQNQKTIFDQRNQSPQNQCCRFVDLHHIKNKQVTAQVSRFFPNYGPKSPSAWSFLNEGFKNTLSAQNFAGRRRKLQRSDPGWGGGGGICTAATARQPRFLSVWPRDVFQFWLNTSGLKFLRVNKDEGQKPLLLVALPAPPKPGEYFFFF